jgi:hypothetical protein
MCWNASVSLNTYILGLFSSLFSYLNGASNIYLFIFYQSFISMQLIEYFTWSKTFSNKLLSQISLFLIICQPILSIINIKILPDTIPYLLAAYIIFIVILYTIIVPLHTIDFSMIQSKNGHLSWNWLKLNVYIIFIWYVFLSVRWVIDRDYLTLIVITTLLIITLILYKNTNTFGSLWCWIVAILSFYLIFEVFHKDFCKI